MYTDLFWKLRPEMLAFLQLEDMSAVDLEAYCFQSLVVVRGAVIVMYVLKQELLTVFVQKKKEFQCLVIIIFMGQRKGYNCII